MTGSNPSLNDLDRDLDLILASDPTAIANPYPVWNRLREQAPVHRHAGSYLFSRNMTIRKLMNDPRAGHGAYAKGSRASAIRAGHSPAGQRAFDEVSAFEALYMSRTDDEPHARLRRIAQRTFTARRIAQIQDVITESATKYLNALEGQAVVDIMPFAYRLPLKVIGDMLSVPEEDLEMVHAWSGKLGRNRGGTDESALLEAHAALGEFRAYVVQMIRRLRTRPKAEDDVSLVGDLLDANAGESLSDVELAAMIIVLLFAGHETTTNLIGTGLMSLLQHDQWGQLCADKELLAPATEELVRFVTPVQWSGRVITEPFELDGVRLQEGDSVLLMLAAANRDPEVIANPDVVDIDRPGGQFHLGFGMGGHVCLGSHLARMEAMTAFSLLGDRYPNLRLATDQFEWTGHAKLRSLVSLPVALRG